MGSLGQPCARGAEPDAFLLSLYDFLHLPLFKGPFPGLVPAFPRCPQGLGLTQPGAALGCWGRLEPGSGRVEPLG